MEIIREIKWACQRVIRGWDDTALWELDSHFVRVIIPPLRQFCEEELGVMNQELNPDRAKVFRKTLQLIQAWEKQDYDQLWSGEPIKKLATYFGENINYYWN